MIIVIVYNNVRLHAEYEALKAAHRSDVTSSMADAHSKGIYTLCVTPAIAYKQRVHTCLQRTSSLSCGLNITSVQC
jgi:hypothetical protein